MKQNEMFLQLITFLSTSSDLYPKLAKSRLSMLYNTPFSDKDSEELEQSELSRMVFISGKELALQQSKEFLGGPFEFVIEEINKLNEIKKSIEEQINQYSEEQRKGMASIVKMMNEVLKLIEEEAEAARELALHTIEK
jgi:uncharacterized protein (UPF0335 family)